MCLFQHKIPCILWVASLYESFLKRTSATYSVCFVEITRHDAAEYEYIQNNTIISSFLLQLYLPFFQMFLDFTGHRIFVSRHKDHLCPCFHDNVFDESESSAVTVK